MAKFGIAKHDSEIKEPKWHKFLDEGDDEPIEFLIGPWTRTEQTEVDNLCRDRKYIEGLGLKWNSEEGRWYCYEEPLPVGTGERKSELRTIVGADRLIRDWRNVVDSDGTTPLECTIVAKAWAMERQDFALWAFQKGQEAGGRVVTAEAKNARR